MRGVQSGKYVACRNKSTINRAKGNVHRMAWVGQQVVCSDSIPFKAVLMQLQCSFSPPYAQRGKKGSDAQQLHKVVRVHGARLTCSNFNWAAPPATAMRGASLIILLQTYPAKPAEPAVRGMARRFHRRPLHRWLQTCRDLPPQQPLQDWPQVWVSQGGLPHRPR